MHTFPSCCHVNSLNLSHVTYFHLFHFNCIPFFDLIFNKKNYSKVSNCKILSLVFCQKNYEICYNKDDSLQHLVGSFPYLIKKRSYRMDSCVIANIYYTCILHFLTHYDYENDFLENDRSFLTFVWYINNLFV